MAKYILDYYEDNGDEVIGISNALLKELSFNLGLRRASGFALVSMHW